MVAPRHGFEPRFTAPKAAVLPLDDRGIRGNACSRPVYRLPGAPATTLLQSSRKPFLAGAGCGLQTRCAALVSLVGSTPTGFRQSVPCKPQFLCRVLFYPIQLQLPPSSPWQNPRNFGGGSSRIAG